MGIWVWSRDKMGEVTCVMRHGNNGGTDVVTWVMRCWKVGDMGVVIWSGNMGVVTWLRCGRVGNVDVIM